MDKTIRVGEIFTEDGLDGGIYIWSPDYCLGWIKIAGAQTTSEMKYGEEIVSLIPNSINSKLSARQAIRLYKAAVELGMNEHEDVTYWLRDYIVEKMREAQNIS